MSGPLALVSVSFLSLFLELALIRWLPAHVFSIAFFANTVLIAAFLGLGLGCLRSERPNRLFRFFPLTFAAYLAAIFLLEKTGVRMPEDAGAWIWSYYEGNRLTASSAFKMPLVAYLATVFALTAVFFAPLGQEIGARMRDMKPIAAYALNVLGGLAGTAAFAVLSAARAPAWVWFAAVSLGFLPFAKSAKGRLAAAALLAASVFAVAAAERDVAWTPYYALQTRTNDRGGLAVYVNRLFHQEAVDFDRNEHARQKYGWVYRALRPERVLVIGAGTGNDVAAALAHGAEQIDAVEIDPAILELGRRAHPQKPFDDPRVRVATGDARSVLRRSREKYDLVLFGTLDSHAALSLTSSIRLDNYLYTKEALTEAGRLLNPGGKVALLFSVPSEWMMQKILALASAAFGPQNAAYAVLDPYLFNLVVVAGKNPPDPNRVLRPLPPVDPGQAPTDDWPYLYLERRGMPKLYREALWALAIPSILAVWLAMGRAVRDGPLFFLLGAGFLLLEAKSVTTFSLLFGSTWTVNAVVFSAILATALAAAFWTARAPRAPRRWAWAGLFLSLMALWAVPASALLSFGFWPRTLAAALLAALPVFFSSLVFASAVARTADVRRAMGANLLGAVAGGFLEYSSMLTGLNALYLLALALYGAAFFVSSAARNR